MCNIETVPETLPGGPALAEQAKKKELEDYIESVIEDENY